MKRKYTALVLGLVLSASLMTGCGSNTTTASTSDSQVVYGEVSEINGDTLTIEVGTQKEMTTPDNNASDSAGDNQASSDSASADNSADTEEAADSSASDQAAPSDQGGSGNGDAAQTGEEPSMLDLTGETEEIEVTDDTQIVRQSMGGMSAGQAPTGQAPTGGSDSSSENSDSKGNTPPEKPSGSDDSSSAPEMPSENGDSSSSDDQNTPPEKPSGSDDSSSAPEMPSENGDSSSSGDQNTMPEKPSGSDDSSSAPEMPQGQGSNGDSSSSNESSQPQMEEEEISLDDISEGDIIAVTFDEDGNVEKIEVLSMGGSQGGQTSAVTSYDAATEYTEDTDVSDKTYTSTGTDENAILVSGDCKVNLDQITVSRESSDSTGGDNSSFYGVGAAVLATEGTTTITDSEITTDAKGGAGVFAYGDATVKVSDTTISTKQDTSGGIHVAGGGTLYASNLDVTTQGESSAAIRSDRGGGKIVVDGGTYTSKGSASPAIYSTADIAVENAELTADSSEAICIEGANSVRLFDCDLTGNMAESDQNDCIWNVILYQSMSGDSEEGNSTFEMKGGSLTAENGGMFYTTNTESTIVLSDVDITYAKDNPFFLRCTGNSNARGWGNSGSNGADCSFTAIDQEMKGDVIWDSISELDFYMTDGSTLKGAVTDDETYAGDGGDGYCNLTIDEDSTWIVTGDSTVTNLSCAGTIKDTDGNKVTIKGTDGTVYVKGSSSYTITVTSYSDKADTSDASQISSFEDYQ